MDNIISNFWEIIVINEQTDSFGYFRSRWCCMLILFAELYRMIWLSAWYLFKKFLTSGFGSFPVLTESLDTFYMHIWSMQNPNPQTDGQHHFWFLRNSLVTDEQTDSLGYFRSEWCCILYILILFAELGRFRPEPEVQTPTSSLCEVYGIRIQRLLVDIISGFWKIAVTDRRTVRMQTRQIAQKV